MIASSQSPVRRMIIAPTARVAELFIRHSGYNPRDCRIATRREHLQGCQLDTWETWFLQRMWPCRTHEDVECMEEMMAYARFRGADIRRWWT
ncbi:hypothetical protein ACFW2V_13235 [Streptomyces sp. NPDC058947]|uniref:hypothetical protein n=1 Tax=Streptomyces sp. NPDC058947 TaxID=3346675 RepID=UPI0036956FA4